MLILNAIDMLAMDLYTTSVNGLRIQVSYKLFHHNVR